MRVRSLLVLLALVSLALLACGVAAAARSSGADAERPLQAATSGRLDADAADLMLLELEAGLESDADADLDAELRLDMDAQAEEDSFAEMDAEVEAEAESEQAPVAPEPVAPTAGEGCSSFAELDADADADAEVDADAEAEAEAEVEAEAEAESQVGTTNIASLNLGANARAAAEALQKAVPSVRFTSGTRDLDDQARAMSQNVVKNRKWIGQTYVNNAVSAALQRWVDSNPKAKTAAQIQAGLLSTLRGLSPSVRGQISKHLSGEAFDVQPVNGAAGTKIKAAIRKLPKLDKFLEKEGGLVRWHAQFN